MLPLLYLHGLSSSDFDPALEHLGSAGSVSSDGIHRKVRLEQDKVCLLVMIGVHTDGNSSR